MINSETPMEYKQKTPQAPNYLIPEGEHKCTIEDVQVKDKSFNGNTYQVFTLKFVPVENNEFKRFILKDFYLPLRLEKSDGTLTDTGVLVNALGGVEPDTLEDFIGKEVFCKVEQRQKLNGNGSYNFISDFNSVKQENSPAF